MSKEKSIQEQEPIDCSAFKLAFQQCATGITFTDRLTGKCEPFHDKLEECVKANTKLRMKKNLELGRMRLKKWEKANEELNIPK
ncbi:hypothetical protein BC833DRAFT_592611 [Globomyces pollinis-pini]|nr:hypothetical protein BC833DRAFT_592611 [Globomyces pollinis-pini]